MKSTALRYAVNAPEQIMSGSKIHISGKFDSALFNATKQKKGQYKSEYGNNYDEAKCSYQSLGVVAWQHGNLSDPNPDQQVSQT